MCIIWNINFFRLSRSRIYEGNCQLSLNDSIIDYVLNRELLNWRTKSRAMNLQVQDNGVWLMVERFWNNANLSLVSVGGDTCSNYHNTGSLKSHSIPCHSLHSVFLSYVDLLEAFVLRVYIFVFLNWRSCEIWWMWEEDIYTARVVERHTRETASRGKDNSQLLTEIDCWQRSIDRRRAPHLHFISLSLTANLSSLQGFVHIRCDLEHLF